MPVTSNVAVTKHALDAAHQRFQVPLNDTHEWVVKRFEEATKVETRSGAMRFSTPDGVELVTRPEKGGGVAILTVYQTSPGRRYQRRKKARWSKPEREKWRQHVRWRRQVKSSGGHEPYTDRR